MLTLAGCQPHVRADAAQWTGPRPDCSSWCVSGSVVSSGQSRTVSGRSCRARVAGVGFGWSLLVMWGTRDGRTVPVSPESTRSWLRGRCSARSHRGRIGTDVKGDGWHHPSTESSPSPSCRRAVSRGRERLRILDAVGSPIPRHHPTDRSHRAVVLLGLSDLPTCARCRIRKPPLVPAAAPELHTGRT